jgi:hypothetical protein
MTFRCSKSATPRAPSSRAGWGLRAGLVTAALWSAVLAFWPWEAGLGQTPTYFVMQIVAPENP